MVYSTIRKNLFFCYKKINNFIKKSILYQKNYFFFLKVWYNEIVKFILYIVKINFVNSLVKKIKEKRGVSERCGLYYF